MFLESRL